MGELESKISDILNSPEEMQKILNIARSFTDGDVNSSEPEEKNEPAPKPEPAPEPVSTPKPEPEKEPDNDSSKFSLDDLEISPEMLKTLGSIMGELTSKPGGGGTTSMLGTITPFLKEERKSQLKSAFSLAKMVKVALGIFTGSSESESKDRGGGGGRGGGDVNV